jgi:hypothetical protein
MAQLLELGNTISSYVLHPTGVFLLLQIPKLSLVSDIQASLSPVQAVISIKHQC